MIGKYHIPVIAFIGGGVLSHLSGLSLSIVACLMVLWIFLFRLEWLWSGLILLSASFGFLYLSPDEPPVISSSPDSLTATIASEVQQTPQTIQMTMNLTDRNEKMLLSLLKDEDTTGDPIPTTWKYGATCLMRGERALVDEARNPGQFNYRDYLNHQGVYSQMVVEHEQAVVCQGHSPFYRVFEWRKQLINDVRVGVSPQAFAWMAALVFGDTNELDKETVTWFQDFGLSHLLAISGLHVGLAIGGLFLVLFRTGLATSGQSKVIIILFLPAYCFLAGTAPSVVRASLMALIVLLFSLNSHKIPTTDLLSVIAFVLLLLSPSYLTNIGFQFSFLVTFSLLLSLPILSKYTNIWIQSAIISFICQLAILPIQIHYFYQFNPLSLVANILLVPYFSCIVIPMFFLLFVLCVTLPGIPFGGLSEGMANIHESFLHGLQQHSELWNIQWIVGEISSLYILSYFVFFIMMMSYWGRQLLRRAFLCGVSAVMILVGYSLSPYLSAEGTVTMLDIGQGDAFVIELPFRKAVIMIDAAGPPPFNHDRNQIADRLIAPYLKSRGISTINGIIVSHKDTDHSGSVQAMMDEFEVGTLFVSPYFNVEGLDGKVIRVHTNDRITIADQSFRILHPHEDAGNPNDNSIVLLSDLGGLKWLFTGDISEKVEAELIHAFPSLDVDVLKVAHHGSETSTSEGWLQQLKPTYALISAGQHNRYGHPHPVVVERLKKHRSKQYQTKVHGAVQYNFTGQTGTFSTFLPYNASRE